MNTHILNLYNSIPKDFFNLKIVHHGATVNTLFASNYFNDKVINLSSDLVLIQVNDERCSNNSSINKIKFNNKDQIIDIVVPIYHKWLSKPKEILKYIKENYNTLPNFILYTDGSDVAILNDILNPKEMLDYYQCDVLFNCEPNYLHTGFGEPSHDYYNKMYETLPPIYENLNEKKYGIKHRRSLNGGVFLGKKDYLIPFLEESIMYMEDDHKKEFPYGCLDDQCMFRWMQNEYFDKISVDVFNKYFLFAYPKSIEVDENDWEHFSFFKRNHEKLYLEKFPNIKIDSSKTKKINVYNKLINKFLKNGK